MTPRLLRHVFILALAATMVTGGLAATTRWERRLDRAAQALQAGLPASALSLAMVPSGHDTPEAYYLCGTALLLLGRYGEAVEELTGAVLREADAEVRRRALHNLALAHLRVASTVARPAKEVRARASVLAAREALRLLPDAPATRWNLALAQRLAGAAEGAPSQGDEGGVQISVGSGGGVSRNGGGAMTEADAIGILDALRSDEAALVERTLARLAGRGGLKANGGGPRW